MFRFLKPKCWKWREDEGKTRETELNGWNHGCYSDSRRFPFLLLFLFFVTDWFSWTANQNTRSNGQKLADYRAEQHIVSASAQVNSNTTCISFFAAWYQTKLAQFLFFRTTKITFFFQYCEHMQHLGPRTLTDGPTIGQLGPDCFISWSFVVVILALYRIYSNHGYVTLLRLIICWIYTFCTFNVVQTPSLIVC